MIPSNTDLHYFVTVTETGNLSRASERLGVVQPTLSQSIRRLEHLVGKPLFVRQKSGMVLTRAGEALRDNTLVLLRNWEKVLEDVSRQDITPSGSYSVGCHPSVGLYSLNSFMRKVLSEPGISVRLEHGLSREITEQVVSRRLDFGLVINPVKHADLVMKKICVDRVGIWRATGAPNDVLIYDPDLQQAQRILKKSGREFKRYVPSNNLEIIADLAAGGCGLAILPERVARKHKELKPAENLWHADELFLVFRADQSKTAGFRYIADQILSAKI